MTPFNLRESLSIKIVMEKREPSYLSNEPASLLPPR